jgi:MFS family permease
MRDTFAPLRLPGFRPLAFAYTVNELGNWLGEIALAVLVFDETGSPLATAGLFLGMQFLPALLGQGLVARLETTGTRSGLPVLYAVEAVTFAALAILSKHFALALVIALAAVDGVLALAGRALTRAAAVAVLDPAGQLRQGNALLNVGFTAAGALGPLTGGLVVAGLGVQTALLLDAVSFLLVAATLIAARTVPNVKGMPERWWGRLQQGLRYVSGEPILRRLLTAQAAAFVFFAAVIPIEIVYVKETLDAGSGGYGVLLASWGVGMVAGSVVFAAARRVALPPLLLISTLAVGVSYLAMSAAGTIVVACLAAAVGGAGNGVQWVSVVSAIQGQTATAYQARVLALLESTASAMPGLGFVLGGLSAELFDPRVSFALAGAGVVAVAALATPMLRPVASTEAGAGRPSVGWERRVRMSPKQRESS